MSDPGSAAIVEATINLGHSLGLAVIAEGVEDEVSSRRLRALGCDVGQGYLFGRPMPAGAIERSIPSQPASRLAAQGSTD